MQQERQSEFLGTCKTLQKLFNDLKLVVLSCVRDLLPDDVLSSSNG